MPEERNDDGRGPGRREAGTVPWNRGASAIAGEAERVRALYGHPSLGAHHWLVPVVERYGPMAAALADDFAAPDVIRSVREKLGQGDAGAPLSVPTAAERASLRARLRGGALAAERDLVAVILEAAGFVVSHRAGRRIADGSASAAPPTPAWTPIARQPTPTLEQFGRDLTTEAAEGRLSPIVGRDGEIDLVVETLCRRTKRNPVLVGPAGVGKTAIVEGLAQRILAGNVPAPLRGMRVFALQPSTLVAGARHVGDLEQRMKSILSEASQPGVLLFIDEVHSIIGAGGMPGTGDIASQLKPVLARGDLALVAATTDDEYRQFIEPDSALERRFQPVRVHELSMDQTVQVLFAVREVFARRRGVEVPDDVLRWIVGFALNFMRNRRFPDKAVDLLDQCVAHAMATGRSEVDRSVAEAVASRMIGRPLPGGGDGPVAERILRSVPLVPHDAEAIANRLAVTTRSLDIRPHRPNAVILLAGEAASNALPLAEVLAEVTTGSPERVVVIDTGRFVHREDLTMLVGAPPGYVGYGDVLPLHRLVQMPWSVLVLQGLEGAHPQIRDVVAEALANGYFTDGQGRRIWLSDTTVILTSSVGRAAAGGAMGFGRGAEAAPEARPAAVNGELAEALGPALLRQVDVVATALAHTQEARRRYVEGRLLPGLAERWRHEGVRLEWDESLVRWILERPEDAADGRTWERLVEEELGPAILERVRAGKGPVALRLSWKEGALRVDS